MRRRRTTSRGSTDACAGRHVPGTRFVDTHLDVENTPGDQPPGPKTGRRRISPTSLFPSFYQMQEGHQQTTRKLGGSGSRTVKLFPPRGDVDPWQDVTFQETVRRCRRLGRGLECWNRGALTFPGRWTPTVCNMPAGSPFSQLVAVGRDTGRRV